MREIIFYPGGDWRVTNGAGQILRGEPVAGRLVHPVAVCFSIRVSKAKKVPVVVLSDMCSAEAFRQLRAWLGAHGEDGADARARSFSIRGRHDDFRP